MKAAWGAAPGPRRMPAPVREDPVPRAADVPPAPEPTGLIPEERAALIACFAAAVIAIMFPYPTTKVVVGTVLAIVFLVLSVRHFHIAVALFAFLLPLQVLIPPGSYFIRGLNLETL